MSMWLDVNTIIPVIILIVAYGVYSYSKRLTNRPLHRSRITLIMNVHVLKQVANILVWLAIISSVLLLFPSIFSYKLSKTITVKSVIVAVTFFVAVYVTSRALSKYVTSTATDKTITVKMRIAHYTVTFIAFIIMLKYLHLGAQFTNVLLAGSITSIIIGLAAQKTIGNFIAGLILLADKPFQIGDYIEVEGVQGFVKDVQFMSTIIKTLDEKMIRIPNEQVITQRVTNYKKNRIIKITHVVGVSYDADIEKVKRVIREALEEEEFVLAYPEPFVSVHDYGNSSVNIVFWFYTPFEEWYTISRRILENVKKKLDENGIVIPYPQLVVHGGSPVEVRTIVKSTAREDDNISQ